MRAAARVGLVYVTCRFLQTSVNLRWPHPLLLLAHRRPVLRQGRARRLGEPQRSATPRARALRS